MKNVSRHKSLERIGVDKEAFFYLVDLSREQRGCGVLTDVARDRIWRRRKETDDDLVILNDESMGGGDGTYYGRWTSWSCEELKSLLQKAGHTWVDLEPIEFDCIDVYI